MRPLIKRMKDRAWDTFSLWIRARDKQCVTCGSTNNLQAGHYWHNVLDFDEENVNAQCRQCNHFLSGNLAVYASYLIAKIGTKRFKALDIRHTRAMASKKMEVEDYQKIIDKYKM